MNDIIIYGMGFIGWLGLGYYFMKNCYLEEKIVVVNGDVIIRNITIKQLNKMVDTLEKQNKKLDKNLLDTKKLRNTTYRNQRRKIARYKRSFYELDYAKYLHFGRKSGIYQVFDTTLKKARKLSMSKLEQAFNKNRESLK